MSFQEQNIIITPNVGVANTIPKIDFISADASTNAKTISLKVYPTSNGTLSFEGNTGQLFSITDSMSGTIFSVNDISGIPSIEVIDTGLIKLAQYSGSIAVGKTTANTKLDVSGDITCNTVYASKVIATEYTTPPSNIVIETSNTKILSESDNGKILYFTSNTAITVNTAPSLSVGFSCSVVQANTGQITFVKGANTIMDSLDKLVTTSGQYALATVICPFSNTFILLGNLV